MLNDNLSDKIQAYLESQLNNYLQDLLLLVEMDSYSYDREDVNCVVDWIAARLLQMQFEVQRHPEIDYGDNLVAVRRGTGRGKILLLGHSDTVFPKGTTRSGTIQGDKVLGSGVYDMKGGLLTGLYAVSTLAALSIEHYEQVTFLIVSDEEVQQRSSIDLISKTLRGHDAVLTLEGARENGDIVTARKGAVWVEIKAFGKSAHAGVEPHRGRNAIMGLVHKFPSLVALANPTKEITVNVGTFEGGTLANVVPDKATVTIDVRAFHQSELNDLKRQIETLFATPTDYDGIRFEVNCEDVSPPMPKTEAIAHLESLAKQAATEIGFEVKGAKTGGASDAALAAAEGIPVLDGLGPIGGLDHSPNEYIEKSSIVPRTALLARLIMLIKKEV